MPPRLLPRAVRARVRLAVLTLLTVVGSVPGGPVTTAAGGTVGSGSGIAFTGTAESGEVLLRWDRDADAVRAARQATLTITDGGRTETLELDPSWLRRGGLAYRPIGSVAGFELRLEGIRGTVTEAIEVRIPPQAAAGLPRSAPARGRRAGHSQVGELALAAIAAGLLLTLALLLVRIARASRTQCPPAAGMATGVAGAAARIPVSLGPVAPPVSIPCGGTNVLAPCLQTSFPEPRRLAGMSAPGPAPAVQSPWRLAERALGVPLEWSEAAQGPAARLADAS